MPPDYLKSITCLSSCRFALCLISPSLFGAPSIGSLGSCPSRLPLDPPLLLSSLKHPHHPRYKPQTAPLTMHLESTPIFISPASPHVVFVILTRVICTSARVISRLFLSIHQSWYPLHSLSFIPGLLAHVKQVRPSS